MKKVLTILAVLIVLTSAVFAASEVHTIRVKADVDEVIPAFQLALDSTKTNLTPNVFSATATYDELANDSDAVETGWTLDEGGSVTVTAVLANPARTLNAYTLTFGNGQFSVFRHGKSGVLDPSIETTEGSKFTGISSIAKTDESDDSSPVTVTFDGKTVKDTDVGKTLATAVYTYAGDPEIDLGTYYADIVLTVATV